MSSISQKVKSIKNKLIIVNHRINKIRSYLKKLSQNKKTFKLSLKTLKKLLFFDLFQFLLFFIL